MGVLADRLADLIQRMKESDEKMLRATDEFLTQTKEHIHRIDQLLEQED